MEGLTSLLGKLSVEDIEKLKLLLSLKPDNEYKSVITLRVFVDEYEIHIRNNRSHSYFKSVVTALNYLIEYFKQQKAIGTITLKDIESFLTFLQQKVKTRSCFKNKVGEGYAVYYRNLKAAFNKAKDWGYVNENYFTKIKLPKKQKVQPAFINSSLLSAIGNKIKTSVVRDVIVFGFYTGMRLNEIVNLKWKNLNLTTRIITVGDEEFITKGKNQRFIPICDEALGVLLRRKKNVEGKTEENPYRQVNEKIESIGGQACMLPLNQGETFHGYIFCKSNGERYNGDYLSKKFKEACKAAGIDKSIHFHSLRHSFASNLVQQGISLYVIKELLGHSSISTTEIYSHLNIDSLREAISVLDEPDCSDNNVTEIMTNTYLSKIVFKKDTGKRQVSSKEKIASKKKTTPGLKIILTNKINGG